jgi:glycosyltransferase involved in cell wall biosynthesis
LTILKGIAAEDRRVKVIANARNFGSVRSAMHALLQARGDAVIGLVADLQDPPELIPDLIAKWEEGYSMVLFVKKSSQENPIMFRLRKLYYRTIERLSSINTFENFTGSGLYDRKVVEAVRSFDDPYPYFRGMIAEIGLPYFELEYDQPKRKRGSSKNNFYALYDLAMLAITQLSKIPLRFVTFAGFVCSALCVFIGFAYFVYKLLFWDHFSLGIAPLVIGLFLFASVQMLSLGIMGEYIATILTQVQRRPYVVERERVNFDLPADVANRLEAVTQFGAAREKQEQTAV